MSSEVATTTQAAQALGDGDNSYKAVQAKLRILLGMIARSEQVLEELHATMGKNAHETQDLADDIERADLDPEHVLLTQAVADALHSAETKVRGLLDTTHEVADTGQTAMGTHRALYAGLDEVRSNRRERTPKPGFFED